MIIKFYYNQLYTSFINLIVIYTQYYMIVLIHIVFIFTFLTSYNIKLYY